MSPRRPEKDKPRLFPALLKYWRGRRGMSQLDLAVAADVSSRHVSFLETGRAKPSENMVLRLGGTLDLPLREQNQLLAAAGFEPLFEEPALGAIEDPGIRRALDRMMRQQEPYPMVVMNRVYDVITMNAGAQALLSLVIAEPAQLEPPINVMRALYDPTMVRPFLRDWQHAARHLLARLQREALHAPEDDRLRALVEEILAFPGVPSEWRAPDFSRGSEATMAFRLKRGDLELAFLTTLTVFSAPQNVTLEEIRIESYFPLDDATEEACRSLGGGGN